MELGAPRQNAQLWRAGGLLGFSRLCSGSIGTEAGPKRESESAPTWPHPWLCPKRPQGVASKRTGLGVSVFATLLASRG